MSFRRRDLKPEIMDDLSLDRCHHEHALRGLARLNFASGAAGQILRALENYFHASGKKSLRILDVACGGGDVLRELALKARAKSLPFVFEGCDLNPDAIEYAQRHSAGMALDFFTMNAFEDAIPGRFDAVISSLFIHHLEEAQAVKFFASVRHSNAQLLVINDLERSFSGWLLVWAATRLLSRSAVVHFDGPQSVRAAFTRAEIRALAGKAGLTEVKIESRWPRFLLTWRR